MNGKRKDKQLYKPILSLYLISFAIFGIVKQMKILSLCPHRQGHKETVVTYIKVVNLELSTPKENKVGVV